MDTLIWIYIALYIVATVFLFAAAAIFTERRDPLWETVADYVFVALGLAGMLLYQLEVEARGLEIAWRVIAPALIVYQVVLNVVRRKQRLAEEEAPDARTVLLVDLGIVALLGPSLVLNMLYAYG